jgi:hypothetical protein
MPTFPHQFKLLGAADRCRVANTYQEIAVPHEIMKPENKLLFFETSFGVL